MPLKEEILHFNLSIGVALVLIPPHIGDGLPLKNRYTEGRYSWYFNIFCILLSVNIKR